MDLFPTTIALGKAFCNRVEERKFLKQTIKLGRHVVMLAPRCYGKTSLINQVLLETKLPFCLIEFTMATNLKEVEHIVLRQVSALLHTILPKTTKAKQHLLATFKWLNPELVLTAGGEKLTFHPHKEDETSVDHLVEILKRLDDTAGRLKKRIVMVMDEFQQLSAIGDASIEAAIRHAMQYSKHVSYIFSGSDRHTLKSLFNSKNKPFYRTCEVMELARISAKDYEKFIQSAAKQRFGKWLAKGTVEKILQLTAHHPSYLNKICGHFWMINEYPTIERIEDYWQHFVASKSREFTDDILNLSQNQKKVLGYLAVHPTEHPGSQQVCGQLGLSEASVRQAMRVLILKDYIDRDQQGVMRVLDPAMRDYLLRKNL